MCAGSGAALCRITDARGITTTLAYDALGRLTGKTYSDTTPSVTYAYDQTSFNGLTITNGNGLRTGMTDGSGSTAWSFDKMGRVLARQQTISAVTKSIGYTYNLDGSVATMTYPSGRVYTYAYNNAGQIASLVDTAHSINFFSSPQYAPPGMLTSGIHGAVTGWNAITLTNTFNNRLEPTQFQAASPVPLTLLNLSYNYDQGSGKNNGNVVSVINNRDLSRSVSYTYDQLNRLATAQTASTWGDSYTYDAWGNLLQKNVIEGTAESMTLTVNNQNQVTTPGFTYDAAGNATWDTSHALNYDAEGHMTPVSGVTYTYDGDGRRVLKSDGTFYWVDDKLRPISVGTASGSITRDYIFLGSQRIAMVPLASGNPYYYLSDRLGSTAVIASGDGKTIQWEADYFPFGSIQQVFTNIVGNNYEFTGYENDSETGYNYANARFDSGRWGRFLSPDPYLGSIDLTNPQSLNRQAYVLNNSTNMVDTLGLAADGCPFGTEPNESLDGKCEFIGVLGIDPSSLGPEKEISKGGKGKNNNNQQGLTKQQTDCIQSEIDYLNRFRNDMIKGQNKKYLRNMAIGFGAGAARGAFVGFEGSELVGGVETGGLIGIPGAIAGGIIGGVVGAGASIVSTFFKNTAQQASFDLNFNQKLKQNIQDHCGVNIQVTN